ncbi:MAG: N-formylglutamate amidohydrolase, partial [Gammaproteobacteria bacterium]|nr:N-formylglutamate amidohydrolase [Gammaproteobacteria bacterium]
DIGALAVARRMSEALGAPLVYQPYSRLVIDCNRAPGVDSSIPVESDGTRVPGNLDLTPAQIEARVEDVFRPYHETMGRLLDERAHRRRPTVLVSVHSFTPTLRTDPSPRPWAIGVIYGRDARIARHLIRLLREALACEVGDNRPYVVDLENDYTIPVHGERRGLPCVELELSQDLVADAEGQRRWADLLVEWLPRAV